MMLFSIQMSSSIFAFSQVSEDVCNHLSPSVDRSGLALFSPFNKSQSMPDKSLFSGHALLGILGMKKVGLRLL